VLIIVPFQQQTTLRLNYEVMFLALCFKTNIIKLWPLTCRLLYRPHLFVSRICPLTIPSSLPQHRLSATAFKWLLGVIEDRVMTSLVRASACPLFQRFVHFFCRFALCLPLSLSLSHFLFLFISFTLALSLSIIHTLYLLACSFAFLYCIRVSICIRSPCPPARPGRGRRISRHHRRAVAGRADHADDAQHVSHGRHCLGYRNRAVFGMMDDGRWQNAIVNHGHQSKRTCFHCHAYEKS
jgi:hypothetical protein